MNVLRMLLSILIFMAWCLVLATRIEPSWINSAIIVLVAICVARTVVY